MKENYFVTEYDVSVMPYTELKKFAKDICLKGYSKMNEFNLRDILFDMVKKDSSKRKEIMGMILKK